MEDLEITTLPTAEPKAVHKLTTLGYDSEGNAAQVRLSDLSPQIIKAASIDFMSGLFISRQSTKADGLELRGVESDDEIILKAIPITH